MSSSTSGSASASDDAASAPIRDQLAAWGRRLARLADDAPDAVVECHDQLEIENLIAAGVAELAGEPRPDPLTEPSGRTVLARDLLITTDLVHRALQHHHL